MFGIIQNIDLMGLKFIQEFLHYPVLDKLMIFITTLGNGGGIWITVAVYLLLNKKYRKIGIMSIIALVLVTILGEGLMKHIVQRLRPFADYPTFQLIIAKSSLYSFPSGHTASSFAVAGVLSKEFKKYRVGIFSFASLIAFSRIYLFVHYPSDIVGGIILGLFSAWITYELFNNSEYSLRAPGHFARRL